MGQGRPPLLPPRTRNIARPLEAGARAKEGKAQGGSYPQNLQAHGCRQTERASLIALRVRPNTHPRMLHPHTHTHTDEDAIFKTFNTERLELGTRHRVVWFSDSFFNANGLFEIRFPPSVLPWRCLCFMYIDRARSAARSGRCATKAQWRRDVEEQTQKIDGNRAPANSSHRSHGLLVVRERDKMRDLISPRHHHHHHHTRQQEHHTSPFAIVISGPKCG